MATEEIVNIDGHDYLQITYESGLVERRLASSVVHLPQPKTISRLEFTDLCQDAGGMTDAMLVASNSNPALAALWLKFNMVTEIHRDSDLTKDGLVALSLLEYLPNGIFSVNEAWPTT